jgi:hypothetical protein
MGEKDEMEKHSVSTDWQSAATDGQMKKVGIWQRFENRIYGSELYQIFIARALKNQWSRITYAFFIVSICGVISRDSGFNHVYKPEDKL